VTGAAPVDAARAAPPDPVDWALASRVARRVAGRDPLGDSYLAESLRADFASVTEQAEALVAEHTGLRAPGRAHATVLDRSGWVDVNVASMRRLIGPLTDRFGERLAKSPLAPIGRSVTATELGVLLGWFAQRVLGQYDLLVPDDRADGDPVGDAVYYVGPNVLGLEKRFAFRPRDFRLWVAIHEVTHRAQFCGVPWMRDYFLGLVEQAMGMVDTDPGALLRSLLRAADELRHGRNPLDDGGVVALLASAEHRDVLARIQALMSVLEGHGNRVMNELGRVHVAGQDRMDRVLRNRRRSGGVTGAMYRVLGLDAKMRQYEIGERFVELVERDAGPRGLDPVWLGPEWLPTLDEIAEPAAWLARVERGEPAPAA
jgi:coenzyme F420 biosynthesis associated uncharacterized protein